MVRLTALEETLFADDTGEARDRLLAVLARACAPGGDCPDAVRLAASAARDVIDTLWARYHGSPPGQAGTSPRG
ncbi:MULTISPECIES: hypothetical protein [Burkholderia]|uniref:Uncharacterized protein n=1 Tax=Burkholderia savannae TaxID=1637837 RepID=A0ABR5T4K0_9BURK|nr:MULTISPECIES: hypothetical protein [Burkholderia]AOJ83909.1 hypothetical protein WS86_25195 [Burkholderia savannae]AOK49859.1 hypothetical protein WT60_23610 [Burkholderia sp. MSMB617WGS]KGS02414.1 hypothetical protein X946_3430 [Burkholderia sp. ABCPW 111]KVK89762.1 hypothetical protein WS91_28125 [Burkholderia sp. MSMB1498]KWZ38152.1 hypothetical protein WS72_25060 [Burkholderia savannae]